ncbi:MAG: HAMP domain-containing histidine kinase [Omnitrophica bacterium]|nr:HAMP domain-containing histidine kinase [Candidatus Omnitrophota bacterium]
MAVDILDAVSGINPLIIIVIVFFSIIVLLSFYLKEKMQAISVLRKELNHLDKTIQDLDQQAKLIIKSDMELNLYQQEIEDKLNKLTLIKNLITSSVHILDTEKLFTQIDAKLINDLGFKKGLLLSFDNLEPKVNIGFKPNEINIIKNILKYKKEVLTQTQLLSQKSETYRRLSCDLQIKDLLISPIKASERIYSIFMVSNPTLSAEIQKSDEEIFLIICMYLNQCLDNIKLFEDLYHSKDDLERRIKERTNELVKSLRAIETISKAKSDFISSVSHELRTPLTSVKGFSSLLVDDKFGKLSEEAKKRLLRIDENVNKLMDIVNTLLDISRIESGKTEVKIAPCEIAKLIEDVADFLTPQIKAKELVLNFNAPKGLNLYMDKNLIERVLINLINNAIKFTPKGGKITIKCEQNGNEAIISVSDTGYGIKKDDLEKLFQEFYRVNNPDTLKEKGSGLGLSLVKRIVNTHNEKIWVESEFGKGTTFFFTLKVVKNG